MEVPRLGVEYELQLPAYATATATPDISRICSLHHGSWQRWIPNSFRARDWTQVLMDICWFPNPLSHKRNSTVHLDNSFHFVKLKLCILKDVPLPTLHPLPQPLAITVLTIQYLSFCDQLVSFCITASRLIHFVADTRIPFLFKVNNIPLSVSTTFCLSSLLSQRPLGGLPGLATVNYAALKMSGHFFFVFLPFLGLHPCHVEVPRLGV